MPNMADITVKKADGTTNIVYNAMTPSSGDGVAAIWRNESGGASAGLKPLCQMDTKWNGQRTGRRISFQFWYPYTYTDSTTGLSMVKSKVPFTVSGLVPTDVPDTVVAEAVAQFGNLLASALVQSAIKAGFAPT